MIREIDKDLMQCLFVSGAHHLDNYKQAVNDLNVFPVPDGDTGTNMSKTILNAEAALMRKECKTAGEVVNTVASATLRGARGNSGVILSQIMRGFASAVGDRTVIYAADFINALSMASKTAYRAVMKPTEGTILTVIRCISETLEALDEDDDIVSLFEAVIKSGNEALSKTPEYLPVLKKAGVVDAGGKGLMLIFEGMLLALQNGEAVTKEDRAETTTPVRQTAIEEEVRFCYCTEFLVRKKVTSMHGDALKEEIAPRGESVLVIDDDDIIKVHIHTNHPGYVLERAISYGTLSDIKIDNLREQYEEQKQKLSESDKPFGIIAVATGKGVCDLFKELGADYVVSGGQTMNPSAEDLLDAINHLSAKHILLLPNNSNIILTARQAAEMADKKVSVIPSKTVPQGITALMAFDPQDAEMEDTMQAAMNGVKTGSLTLAVRDTEIGDIKVHENDYLALCDGDIVASNREEKPAMQTLFDSLIGAETVSVLLLYGEDVSAVDAQAYADSISTEWPDTEVTVVNGGQPVYRFIISAE